MAEFDSLSLLEEFLDSILAVPVEMKRYLSLIKELDVGCLRDTEELNKLQEDYIQKLKNKKQGDDELLTKSLQNIQVLQKRLTQKLDEKKSIADQLYDMCEEVLKRLGSDISSLEVLLKAPGAGGIGSGDGNAITVGKNVAACTSAGGAMSTGENLWILARVIAFNPMNPDRCTVADVDTEGSTHVLQRQNVVVLPDDEDVQNARERLKNSKTAMAIYPGTTSFYECTLISQPYRLIPKENSTQAELQFKDQVVIQVEFQDDEDANTGLPPKRIIPTVCVFIKPIGTGKRKRDQ